MEKSSIYKQKYNKHKNNNKKLIRGIIIIIIRRRRRRRKKNCLYGGLLGRLHNTDLSLGQVDQVDQVDGRCWFGNLGATKISKILVEMGLYGSPWIHIERI